MSSISNIQLRDYQQRIIQSLRNSLKQGNKRIVMCAPTGAGKTIMFCYMVAEHYKRNGSILIFTHRKELLNQAGSSFEKFGLKPKYIKAGSYPDTKERLHVAMVETFSRRILQYESFLKSRTMIIFDEAHLDNFTKIFPYISNDSIVIGATATPFRKGNQPSLSEFYTDIVQEIDTPELIEMGFLSDAKTYGVDIDLKGIKKKGDDYDTSKYYEENKVYEGVVFNWEKHCKNQKTLLFASNVENSKKVCNEFNSHGYEARHIDGNTPDHIRVSTLRWFSENDSAIVCNCGILNAGFDQPDIKVVILYRATTSLPLFLQMCGRGSRVTPEKRDFTILDFGNNIKRLNFWEYPREWGLEKEQKRKKEGVAPVKECKNCGALIPTQASECKICGFEIPKEVKERNPFAELILLPKPQMLSLAARASISEKAQMAKEKIISPFWVLHQLTDKEEAREFCKLMGYKKGFEHYNKERFKVFRDND